MNRNYKVIWNASLNCFMAVSEYAKARGKSSKSSVSANATINTTSNLSSTNAFRLTAIGLGLMAAGLTMSPQVFAVTGVGGAVDTGVTNCGTNASAGKTGSVAVGCNSVADLSADPAVNFYQRGNPDNLAIDISTAFNSTAVGTGARATEAGTSLGMNASSRNLGIAVGIQAKSENVAAVAIGPAALAKGNTSLALGRQSAATADFAQAIGNVASATGKGSLAVGHSARAEGYRSIAIGSADIDGAQGTGATQPGVKYQTNQQTLSKGLDSIAIGSGAIADATFGFGASGTASTAIGKTAKAKGPNTLALGANSDAKNGTAVGSGAIVRNGGLAVGMHADAGPGLSFLPTSNVALGDDSKVTSGAFNVALGAMAVAGDSDLSAQAYRPIVGIAVAGENAVGEVSIGGDSSGQYTGGSVYRRITNLAAGAADTDGVNVSQLKTVAAAAEARKIKYVSIHSTGGTNEDNLGASGGDAIAIGKNASAAGMTTVAVGLNAGVGSTQSEGVSVGNRSGQNVLSNGNTALGVDAGSNIDSTPRTTFDGKPAYNPFTIVGQNTGIGAAAGKDVYGNSNSALGERAGREVDGHANTSVGAFSGNNVIGSANVAMGANAGVIVKGDRNTAIGNFAGAYVEGKVNSAFGNGAGSNIKGEYNLALGSGAGAGISNDLTVAIGNNAGNIQNGQIGKNSISVGTNSSAQGHSSMALGRGSISAGKNATGIGVLAKAGGESSVAIGDGAEASGKDSIAMGTGSKVTGDNSGAFGDPNIVSGIGSYAIGNNNNIANNNSFVLGNNVGTTQDNSVVLGNLSTDRAATTETGVMINGTTYTYAGQGSAAKGVVSVGSIGAERQIINVAAGRVNGASTDAINGSQLHATNESIVDLNTAVAANKTKYYSVKSDAVGNADNLGATGANAMAMGGNAKAEGGQAIAIGSVGSTGKHTIAKGQQSIAIGANVQSLGASSIAIGGDDLDAASQTNIDSDILSDLNAGTVNASFKAYSGNKNLVETNKYDINTESAGAASIAIGSKSLSGGDLSTAVGVHSSSFGTASSAFGVAASAREKGSVAIGAGSVADRAGAGGGIAAYTGGATGNALTAINSTIGRAELGAVSVGPGGEKGTRQIINVAAGSADSDAVNVSQLKGGVSSVVNLGLKFDGDTGTTVKRPLGQTLNVLGGESNATKLASGNNIGVVADGSDTLTVKLAKDLTGLNSANIGGSVINTNGLRVGNTLVNQNGFTFLSTGSPSNTVRLSDAGLHNGNKQVTGVLSGGTTLTNAANIGDVKSAAAGSRTEVKAGTNIADVEKTVGDKGQDIYTVNAKGSTAAAGSSAVTVNGNDVGDNITDYTVDLSQDTKDSLVKANNSVQYDSSARTRVTLGGGGTAPVTLTNVAEGDISENSSDAVNGSQLFKTNTKVNKGFGLKAADGQMVVKQLGDQVEVVGANNNITTKVIDGKVAVDLNNNLDLGKTGSVKMGNTTVSKDGMTIVAPTVARTVVLSSAGLNNGGNKITNVLAGTQDTDAVNVKQLNLANTTIDKGLSFGGDSGDPVNRKLGETLTVKGGDTINADPATKNISVTANGKDTLTVRLAKDINLGNTGSLTTGNTQVNNAGITLYRGDNDQVALTNNGLNNGNNKITNVAQGTTGKDAVNFDQLSLTNTNVSTNAAGIKTNKDAIALGIKIGDGNSANDQQFALGSTINVTGDSNITTTASATGVQVKLNNQLNLGDDGRMQMGNSIMNNTGFTFVGNEPGRTVILGAGGLNNGFNRITNVAAGLAPTDAATVGQLSAATFALDKGWALSAQDDEATMVKQGSAFDLNSRDGNIKISRTAAASSVGRVSRAVDPNDMTFDLNRDIAIDSVQTGDTTINNQGLTIVGGPSVTKAGINAADTKVTNVVNGEVAANSKDAINGGQLYAQGAGISSIIGGNTTYDPVTGTFTNSNIGGTGQASIDGAIASIKRGEAVMTESIQTNTTNITTNTSNITKNTANIATNTANISTNTTNIKANTDKIDAGLNFGADSGAVINKPIGDGSVMSFKGGNNIKTTAEGSSIKFDLNGNINVESVTTGNTTVNNSGVTIKNGPSMTAAGIYAGNTETAPSMTAAGINAAGTKVTNVADGMAPRDAVNYGQLEAVTRGLGGSINELGYKIGEVEDDANAGISAAMAMSSLPQAYIIGKPMIGGGIATFNGESAVAIGFSKMSNDGRWVMKLNGTADTQGNVGGAIGAGFHFD
ncbi:YadA-like family protein [Psychrobacter pulmonis]|uniref:YadA-like family protein n=1 Tax=Psychrobacter pulmonis TaxID=228654 RepID=UPI001919B2AD|nr:YadA-like family protein [Psychrobacter pulmonis]